MQRPGVVHLITDHLTSLATLKSESKHKCYSYLEVLYINSSHVPPLKVAIFTEFIHPGIGSSDTLF